MKKTQLFAAIFTLFISASVFGQISSIPRGEPTPQEIEKRKRKVEERREEFIGTFLSTLEADEFQKQIIKQYLDSYVDEKLKLYETKFNRYEEKERAYKNLDKTHFQDLNGMISENDMAAIQSFISGDFDEKKAKKANKKKKKKNKD